MAPTNHEPERSAHDLAFELAEDRVAGLRARSAIRASVVLSSATTIARGRGPLGRSRDALGRALIGLGTALVLDEGLRRRAIRP